MIPVQTVEQRRAPSPEPLLAGPIDTSFPTDITRADRIAYHCDNCGQALELGICTSCNPSTPEDA